MAKRKRRNFTPEFKAEVVLEALSGESSQAEVCRRHNLSDEQLSKWKRQLLENAATLFEPADKQSDASVERIAELEQLVGRLTLALDIQKKPQLTSAYLINTSSRCVGRRDEQILNSSQHDIPISRLNVENPLSKRKNAPP